MEGDAIVALELLRDAIEEAAVDVQPRDFVFVLVREQLEVVARDGLGELGLPGCALALGGAHAVDQIAIALGIIRILISREPLYAIER